MAPGAIANRQWARQRHGLSDAAERAIARVGKDEPRAGRAEDSEARRRRKARRAARCVGASSGRAVAREQRRCGRAGGEPPQAVARGKECSAGGVHSHAAHAHTRSKGKGADDANRRNRKGRDEAQGAIPGVGDEKRRVRGARRRKKRKRHWLVEGCEGARAVGKAGAAAAAAATAAAAAAAQ